MSFIRSSIISTHTLGQLFGSKQAIRFDDMAFAVHPFGLNGVEPGALRWQEKWQDMDTFPRLLDLLVVLANPGANGLTLMPGGVIPNQEPVRLPLLEQTLATPIQELGGDRAHRASADKAQPHLFALGFIWGALLPQHAIAGQGFGIWIAFLEGLFDQTDRMLRVLPGVHARQSKATPPDFISKADSPGWLVAGPGDQPITGVFFRRYCGSGLLIQCLARFQLVLSRLRARRTLSSETCAEMMPCSKLT